MNITSIINKKYSKLTDFVNNLDLKQCQTFEPLYTGRNKIVRCNIAGEDMTIKSFGKPSFINRIIYTYFRKSKARRSYENACKLQVLNVGTAEPIAYKEVYRGGLLSESFYLCRYLDGCADLRWWTEKPDCDEVLEHAGKFIGELHKKGVWHKDFSPGNILYDKDWNFYLVDINRMRFDVHSPQLLMQNFKCLHDEPEETQRIAEKYYKYSPFKALGDDEVIDMALASRAKYKAQQARKKGLKKLFKK